MTEISPENSSGLTRRDFLVNTAAGAFALLSGDLLRSSKANAQTQECTAVQYHFGECSTQSSRPVFAVLDEMQLGNTKWTTRYSVRDFSQPISLFRPENLSGLALQNLSEVEINSIPRLEYPPAENGISTLPAFYDENRIDLDYIETYQTPGSTTQAVGLDLARNFSDRKLAIFASIFALPNANGTIMLSTSDKEIVMQSFSEIVGLIVLGQELGLHPHSDRSRISQDSRYQLFRTQQFDLSSPRLS